MRLTCMSTAHVHICSNVFLCISVCICGSKDVFTACACACIYWEALLLVHCCVQGLVLLCFWMMPCMLYIYVYTCIYVYMLWAIHTYLQEPNIHIHANVKELCKRKSIHSQMVELNICIYSNITECESKNVYILCSYPQTRTHLHTHTADALSHTPTRTKTLPFSVYTSEALDV